MVSSLAIITPAAPGQAQILQQTKMSVRQAQTGARAFSRVEHLVMDGTGGRAGAAAARNRGIEAALSGDFDWLLFLEAGDLLWKDALHEVACYLDEYDGIWGAIADCQHGQQAVTIRSGQVPEISAYRTLLTTDPYAALGRGYFVRARIFDDLGFDENPDAGADYEFFIRLWKKYKCIKAGKVFCVNRHGHPDAGNFAREMDRWLAGSRNLLIEQCRNEALTSRFLCCGKALEFLITNPFDMIQRRFLGNGLFEECELFALKSITPPGGTVIDAGANIGNHTVFFSHYLDAAAVIPFECNPDAITVLEQNLALNNCTNVEQRFLGIGLSDHPGRGSIESTKTNNLGATRYRFQSEGEVRFHTIDSFSFRDVSLIKVDCEGMDLRVLKGAAQTIGKYQPVLFFECFNEQYKDAQILLDEIGYLLFHEFPYVHSRNILAIKSP